MDDRISKQGYQRLKDRNWVTRPINFHLDFFSVFIQENIVCPGQPVLMVSRLSVFSEPTAN